jgi:hypothetical protein
MVQSALLDPNQSNGYGFPISFRALPLTGFLPTSHGQQDTQLHSFPGLSTPQAGGVASKALFQRVSFESLLTTACCSPPAPTVPVAVPP